MKYADSNIKMSLFAIVCHKCHPLLPSDRLDSGIQLSIDIVLTILRGFAHFMVKRS